MEVIPEEVVLEVVYKIGYRDILSLGCCSKLYYRICKDEKIWRKLCNGVLPSTLSYYGKVEYQQICRMVSIDHHVPAVNILVSIVFAHTLNGGNSLQRYIILNWSAIRDNMFVVMRYFRLLLMDVVLESDMLRKLIPVTEYPIMSKLTDIEYDMEAINKWISTCIDVKCNVHTVVLSRFIEKLYKMEEQLKLAGNAVDKLPALWLK